ncbi:helix-turn-helix transcriptional regulator, partial [Glaesserella parasuis]
KLGFLLEEKMENTTKMLFDKKSVATLLDVSVPTINRRMKNDKHFPKPLLIGGKNFWSNEQINHYIDTIQSECTSTA